jgi:hypothetical protein
VARASGDELLVALQRRGLITPLRILVDAHRPITPLLSDAAAMLAPMLGTLGLRDLAAMVADPARTIDRIETLSAKSEDAHGADACRIRES